MPKSRRDLTHPTSPKPQKTAHVKISVITVSYNSAATIADTLRSIASQTHPDVEHWVVDGNSKDDTLAVVEAYRHPSLRVSSESDKGIYDAMNKGMAWATGDIVGFLNADDLYADTQVLTRVAAAFEDPEVDACFGDLIYDAACGSAGFLCEAFAYLSPKATKADDLETLQKRTFYGKEKKSLAYVIGIMNMILHGIEAPNIVHTNTLGENINDIQERDRYDVILANPPFGGKERKEVQQNYPIKTGETAFLFMQHFIKSLRAGGRAAVVIKNTFLSNTDNASVALRKQLLTDCNLHTVLDCPGGTFQGAGVKTVVLFFTKGEPTRKTWFYQLDPGRNMGKTNPLNDADLVEFVQLQKAQADSPKSWSVAADSVNLDTFDLSVKNPNGGEAVVHRSPADILDEIAALDAEAAEVLGNIRGLLA